MRGRLLSSEEIDRLVYLRKTGHSLPEIRKITRKANSTVFKYVKDVRVFQKYAKILKSKQGGSIARSNKRWAEAKVRADRFVYKLTQKEKVLIFAALYWGEGAKRDLSIINGDPNLIRVSAKCLEILGVKRQDFKITVRVFRGMDKVRTINFWIKLLRVQKSQLVGVETVEGNRSGKLPYGMCRLRVRKGDLHFKFLMSVVDLLSKRI
jgi:hypothetical protein